jgi:hypothetical protein
MIKRIGWFLILIVLAGALPAMAACGGDSSKELSYTAPFETGITAGTYLPGTELQYAGVVDGRAEVYIGGQRALKQKADSLAWEGQVSEDISLELDLRILWFDENTLHAGGTAKVTVANAQARAAEVPEEAPLTFRNAPVAYTVKKGETIPGTLLTYGGKNDQGAELGGTDDYPYRRGGDSIVWAGAIKENVWLRLDVRLGAYTDSTMAVAGLASLWIAP